MSQCLCYATLPEGHTKLSRRGIDSCPFTARSIPVPFKTLLRPRPMARPPRTLLLPPAPALRSCERCLRASLGPAKYRHQVRPAWDRIWRLGEGAQTFVSPETPPAPLAAVAGGGGVPGPEPGCGVPTLRLLRQTGRGSPGAEEGVRAPELPLWVSGARVSGCALGPLPEALQGRGPLQSQLPLPST